jgi:hypothetical protein
MWKKPQADDLNTGAWSCLTPFAAGFGVKANASTYKIFVGAGFGHGLKRVWREPSLTHFLPR